MNPAILRDTLSGQSIGGSGPLTLKLADSDDAQLLGELAAKERADLSKWLAWVTNESTPESITALLHKHIERFAASGQITSIPYLIMKEGAAIGMINLQPKSFDPLCFEFGFWLAREARGQGHACHAIQTMVRALHGLFPVATLLIRTDVTNLAAARIALKAGFVLRSPVGSESNILVFAYPNTN